MEEILQPKLKTNLDTDLLKIIGIITMLIDHIGAAFFPDMLIFRIIGRMTFPIFCYCLTVGLLYTKDIRKYLGRLTIFALISQPFWILAFNADDFMGNIFLANIFFSLVINLLGLWAFKERKWWIFAATIIIMSLFNFDYGITGITLMLIFYLCKNKPLLGMSIYIISYLPALFGRTAGDYFTITIGNYPIGIEIFAILIAPFIFFQTQSHIKISKWVFYAFYPLHLFLIYIVSLFL